MVAGRKSSCGTEPSRPPKAPESSSARVPASTPLPDTSTSATSSWLPSSERVATRKSPENDAPPAERRTTSACQPTGSAGISPWARQPVAQVDQHRVTAGALHAQPPARPGQRLHDRRGRRDHEDGTRRHPRVGRPHHLEHDHGRDHDVEHEQAAHGEQEAAGQHDQGQRGEREPRPVREEEGTGGGRARAQGQQREPVRVQHVAPHPGLGAPPAGLPAAAAARSDGCHGADSTDRAAATSGSELRSRVVRPRRCRHCAGPASGPLW